MRRRSSLQARPRRRAVAGATDWASLRGLLSQRAGGRCERCGDALPAFWEAHHRRRRSQGGLDELCNLAALCGSCHTGAPDAVHRQVAAARAAGWIVPSTVDPAHWPIRLWDGRTVLLNYAGGYRPAEVATA